MKQVILPSQAAGRMRRGILRHEWEGQALLAPLPGHKGGALVLTRYLSAQPRGQPSARLVRVCRVNCPALS